MNNVFSVNVSPTIFTWRPYPQRTPGNIWRHFLDWEGDVVGLECHWIEAMAAVKQHSLHRTPPSNGEWCDLKCQECVWETLDTGLALFVEYWYSEFLNICSVQSLSHVRLCDPMNRNMPGLSVHHQLPKFTQTHVHWVSDAIQPSHPLSSPSPPALNPSQHQSLFPMSQLFVWGGQSTGTFVAEGKKKNVRKCV